MITLKISDNLSLVSATGVGQYEHTFEDGTKHRIVNITLLDNLSRLSPEVVSTEFVTCIDGVDFNVTVENSDTRSDTKEAADRIDIYQCDQEWKGWEETM